MTTNEKKLVALQTRVTMLICGEGAPTWDEIDEIRRLEKLVGKRWRAVNRHWAPLVDAE